MLKNTQASVHLDMIRGLAAVQVLVYHATGLFIDSSTKSQLPLTAARILNAVTGSGGEAVMVFFVLSGLLIGTGVVQEVGRGRWSWSRYLLNRATRMYVVLLPALLITWALDQTGLWLFAGRPDPAEDWVGNPDRIRDRSHWSVLLGNLVFLQTIAVEPYGSNGPLWSLAYEGWYYVLFPCLWLAVFGPGRWRRLLLGLGAVAILIAVGWQIAAFFVIWLFGPLAFWVRGRIWPAPNGVTAHAAGAVAVAVFLAAYLGLHRFPLPSAWLNGTAVGLAFTLFLIYLLGETSPERRTVYSRVARALAGCSFTLYAIHIPLLVFLRLSLCPDHKWPADVLHLTVVAVICIGIVVVSFLIAAATEAHTTTVRDWILQRTTNRQVPPTPAAASETP
jgi:peptidoglycan/LPS O-acetylase OafA/YrhL